MSLIHKIKGKLSFWRRGLAFFVWKPSFSTQIEKRTDVSYAEIKEFSQLQMYQIAESELVVYRDRFLKNEILCLLARDSEVLSYGWINPNRPHYLGEIAVSVNNSDQMEVLYNFETNPQFRGQGLYPYLLSRMCMRNDKYKLIYALVDNASSIKGIKKASFLSLGNIYGSNRNKVHQLLQNIWQD